MSTSYYKLADWISSVRYEEQGPHVRITIFDQGANAGTLCLTPDAAQDMLFRLTDRDDKPVLRTHWGGKEIGAVVTDNDPASPGIRQVVSEYAELLTVAEVRGRAGAQRSDGMPTELFGYEPTP